MTQTTNSPFTGPGAIAEIHGSLDDHVADQARREDAFLSALDSHSEVRAELSQYVSDEFALKEYNDDGDEISTHLAPADILSAQVKSYLAANGRFTSRNFTVAKTSLPRELRVTGGGQDTLLQSRMAWIEVTVDVTHPGIEEIWDDITVCLKQASESVGEKALLGPGKPENGWRNFCKAFYPRIVKATGRSAGEFRMRLNLELKRGPWFVFEE